MSDYSSEKRNIHQAMAEQDKIESFEAENKKLRKCLNAEWDEVAVDKILTDVEELRAELAKHKKVIDIFWSYLDEDDQLKATEEIKRTLPKKDNSDGKNTSQD